MPTVGFSHATRHEKSIKYSRMDAFHIKLMILTEIST